MKVSSELAQDRRAWSASVRGVINSFGDTDTSTRYPIKSLNPAYKNEIAVDVTQNIIGYIPHWKNIILLLSSFA